MIDPFTDEPVKKGKKKQPLKRGCYVTMVRLSGSSERFSAAGTMLL